VIIFHKKDKVCLREYRDICMYVKEVDNAGNCVVWWLDKNGSYNQQLFENQQLIYYSKEWVSNIFDFSGSF